MIGIQILEANQLPGCLCQGYFQKFAVWIKSAVKSMEQS
jgi:hypothetical protein